MPYKASNESLDLVSRLRALLGGGGNDPVASLLGPSVNPSPTLAGLLPQSPNSSNDNNNFLENVLGKGPISGDLSNLHSGQTPVQQTPEDYVSQFLQQMAGMAGQGSGSGLNQADYEQALKNSAAQIKGAFGAEIGAVKASSAHARHITKRSKKQVKAMYKALSGQYDKGANAEVAQGQQIADALQGVATDAAGQLKGTSDQLLNEQAALAQGLGVQSALPTVTAQQAADTAKQVGDIQQYGARQAGDQLANSGSEQRYLARGGKNALLEGTNKRADLVEQLQQFLLQNQGKIADIKGQQGQALATNQLSAAKTFSDAGNKANTEAWNQYKDMADLLLKYKGMTDKSGASSLPKWAQQSSSLLGGTSDPKGAGDIIQQLLGSPEVTRGKFADKSGTYSMTSAKFADEVAKAMKAQGYSDEDIAKARLAALYDYQGYSGG